jgi:DNA-binding transcriptional LysR family regulator
MRKLPDGSLSVLVGRHGADEWLPRVERFGAQYPAYDLRIDTRGRLVDLAAERIDVGIRYGGGRWPGLKATFLTRDAFFPVCSPALLEGAHPLRGPADLQHHSLIRDRSMAFENTFPTWRSWLQRAGFGSIDWSADQRLCGGDPSRHRGKSRGARPNDARRQRLGRGPAGAALWQTISSAGGH